MTENKKPRFYGLDLLRLLFIFSILIFHTYETFFYNNEFILSDKKTVFLFLHVFARSFSFSGFGFVTLTSFLLGSLALTRKRWMYLMGVLSLGFVLLSWMEADGENLFFFQWDIYTFHFFSFALIWILNISPTLIKVVSFSALPLLFFPIWQLDVFLPDNTFIKDALLGDCSIIGHGSWPIFPWVAIPLVSYSLARYIFSSPLRLGKLGTFDKKEKWLWPLLLFLTLPFIGGYFSTPIGPGFACYVHRRPPIEFWSHWLWVIFFMRVSFLKTVNVYLKSKDTVQFLSKLQWSRNIGLAYAIHFAFLNLGYQGLSLYEKYPPLLDLFFITMLVGVEVTCRILIYLKNKCW